MILPTDFLRYSAIAEEDEKYRFKSEAQFPERKSLPFLMERKAVMTRVGRASTSRTQWVAK